ncbi:MAG: MarR family transcriptional regulator [Gammaproteobacteria bacterium]|nr:MarR family transcriptional regulator [Gammaproteobacteria bacterium]
MNTKDDKETKNSLEDHVQELAQHLLLLRKMQDQAGAELLSSLGNLSMQELNILNIIGDTDKCTMSDIAKRASLSLSSVTVIVDKLVKGDLVERVRSEQDRRIVWGRLTEAGYKIYLVQIKHMHDVLIKMLGSLLPEERISFLTVFKKITQSYL